MKKYITFLLLLINISLIYSQEGVEVPLNYDPTIHLISGTYKKDITNYFGPYIGTWIGTWNNKQFTLQLVKVVKKQITYESGYYYYRDLLIGKYSVIDLTDNSVIDDNLSEPDVNLAKINSLSRPKNNMFDFIYMDKDNCSNTGIIDLFGDPTTNHITYRYQYDEFWSSQDCVYSSQDQIPIYIPTVNVVLTRQ